MAIYSIIIIIVKFMLELEFNSIRELTNLYFPYCLFAYLLRSSFWMVEVTTALMLRSGMPRRRANMVSSSRPVILSIRASN